MAGILLIHPAPSLDEPKVAPPSSRSESDVKAQFLVAFARNVEWPPGALPKEEEPFLIGILGKDPFGTSLEALEGRRVQNRRVVVLKATELKALDRCQLIYISPSENMNLAGILRSVKGRGVLTFGETEEFLALGGMVRFAPNENRIGLRVNRRASERAGLKISSHILAYVTVVIP